LVPNCTALLEVFPLSTLSDRWHREQRMKLHTAGGEMDEEDAVDDGVL
jgi:hypothetical protein